MKKQPPTMEFTGERFVPEVHGPIELEHLHRYLQACEIATGKVILDIASGEGYGSAMLAKRAARVVGVDVSLDAVKHARNRYQRENLQYMVGSCADIPLPDASVDLVVSFETVEHHDQHEKMMREVKRVLRPLGVLLISSPDKYHYSVEPARVNPYHVKELYQHEFKALLASRFKNIAYLGQRIIYGSGIFPESLPMPSVSYLQQGNDGVRESSGMMDPTYWIALASDGRLPDFTSNFLEQPLDDSEIVRSGARAVTERDGQIATLSQAVADRDGQIATLTQAGNKHETRMLTSLIRAASFAPKSLQFPNAWVGHLPFGAWLIQQLAPGTLVELGTHSGNSYFSFCQAVVEAKISTRCYAVDTWQGDEHAGRYEEGIFGTVSAFHEKHFAHFSRLLRMTFDEAASYFSDESVDLLHIDGLHTYDAVRHDFESWLPKLAPGAVVLFHDTNVREREFAVWRLWEELQTHYPSNLEFVHSHGLGVLQLNNAPDDKKLEWLQPGSPDKARLIDYFAALGSWHLERYAFKELEQRAASVERALAERDGHIAGLNRAVSERDGHIAGLNGAVAERDRHVAGLNGALAERDRHVAGLNQAVAERDGHIAHITSSNSWRLTAPMRNLRRWITEGVRDRPAVPEMPPVDSPVNQLSPVDDDGAGRGVPEAFEISRYLPNPNTVQPAQEVRVTVDIVIPVYRGLDETKRCLESVLSDTERPPGVIRVIDDCSPEPELSAWLSSLAAGGRIELSRNSENLGFLKTVNRGMDDAGRNDVVLLNSDTEVPSGFLRRLAAHAYSKPKVGSVTPFSNTGGEMCGFPTTTCAPLPQGYSLKEIDDACRAANSLRAIEIPIGVGFCIYIRRDCLDEVGLFDAEAFGRGYGEESDFCLRAAAAGWRHLLACDTFVYHAGEVSFGKNAPERATSWNTLVARHPHLPGLLAQYVSHKPANPAIFAATASLFRASSAPTVLLLEHNFSAGTTARFAEAVDNEVARSANVLLLRPEGPDVELSVPSLPGRPTLRVPRAALSNLPMFLRACGVSRVRIQHWIGLGPELTDFVDRLAVPLDLTVHDYFAV